jgi:hypothetical protein
MARIGAPAYLRGMADNPFVRSIRESREHLAGMLASLERGDLVVASDPFNEARIGWTRRVIADYDRVIQQEEERDAKGS